MKTHKIKLSLDGVHNVAREGHAKREREKKVILDRLKDKLKRVLMILRARLKKSNGKKGTVSLNRPKTKQNNKNDTASN